MRIIHPWRDGYSENSFHNQNIPIWNFHSIMYIFVHVGCLLMCPLLLVKLASWEKQRQTELRSLLIHWLVDWFHNLLVYFLDKLKEILWFVSYIIWSSVISVWTNIDSRTFCVCCLEVDCLIHLNFQWNELELWNRK